MTKQNGMFWRKMIGLFRGSVFYLLIWLRLSGVVLKAFINSCSSLQPDKLYYCDLIQVQFQNNKKSRKKIGFIFIIKFANKCFKQFWKWSEHIEPRKLRNMKTTLEQYSSVFGMVTTQKVLQSINLLNLLSMFHNIYIMSKSRFPEYNYLVLYLFHYIFRYIYSKSFFFCKTCCVSGSNY